MLHALRTSFMALALRRGIATVLAMCVCMAFAEPMFADSCDDDAKATSAQTSVAPDGAGPSVTISPNATESPASNANPAHTLHVCHCVHAHVAPLARRQTLAAAPEFVTSLRVMKSDTTPPSVVQEPQLRPPRTLSVI